MSWNMPVGSARAYAEWEARWDGVEESDEEEDFEDYDDGPDDDSHARMEWEADREYDDWRDQNV